jgi:hypothetical protein
VSDKFTLVNLINILVSEVGAAKKDLSDIILIPVCCFATDGGGKGGQ